MEALKEVHSSIWFIFFKYNIFGLIGIIIIASMEWRRWKLLLYGLLVYDHIRLINFIKNPTCTCTAHSHLCSTIYIRTSFMWLYNSEFFPVVSQISKLHRISFIWSELPTVIYVTLQFKIINYIRVLLIELLIRLKPGTHHQPLLSKMYI